MADPSATPPFAADMACVELGFLEDVENDSSLKSHHFPSKVGGKPAWLSFKPLQTCDLLKCKFCRQPMQFLLQIYAPDYEKSSAFHRTLFLFVCRDGRCCKPNCTENFLVLRCQLPRENQFYPSLAVEDESATNLMDVSDFTKLCMVCGCPGDKQCSKCKKVVYCCRPHQIWHWKFGHKDECQTESENVQMKMETLRVNECLFPEYEILTETEDFTEEKRQEKSDEEKMLEFNKYMRSIDLGSENGLITENFNDLDNVKPSKADKLFKKFTKRLEYEPEQVLRYARSSEPLWATDYMPDSIPPCQLCGAPRTFEFQLMPHLLSHLGVDNLGESLDWATVAVYTFSKSCDVQDFGYGIEFTWKQDF